MLIINVILIINIILVMKISAYLKGVFSMLTKENRKKLLAGTVASIMVAGSIAGGCGNDSNAGRLQTTNSAANKQEDNSKDSSSGNSSSGFWPWFFIGRATADSGVHYNSSNNAIVNKRMSEGWRPGSPKASDTGKGASASSSKAGTTVKPTTSNNTGTKSTLGKTGTVGKTGIGSGMSRSSAVS